MNSPCAQPRAIEHKFGGVITPTHIGHNTDKDGAAYWYVRGNVEWDDGTRSEAVEISPNHLCNGDRKEPLDELLAELNKYLGTAGNWCPPTRLRSGVIVHWIPKEKRGEIPLAPSGEPRT